MKDVYIICHMVTSIDGKVTGSFLEDLHTEKAIEYYYDVNRNLISDGFICGKNTMEGSFTGGYYPDLNGYEPVDSLEDFVAFDNAKRYAISFDRHGSLGWLHSHIEDMDSGYDNTHIVEIVTEDIDKRYLAYLREKKVSYLVCGKMDTNISLALEKLHRYFKIKTLLLEGGSIINGAFLEADFIDEISIVIAPITASSNDKSLFNQGISQKFKLADVKKIDDVIHLRYRKEN